jgi:1-deoxy-D-xylulose-5-phosphate synthase
MIDNSASILETISNPEDLKRLPKENLPKLCDEIRAKIIQSTSKNGGHVGPNLGVVELTIALHLSFSTPHDCFCWDVSHQGYVHKLLTGRNGIKFDHIRQTDGLSGFLNREESEHDSFGAGHAGTALSAALGMCVARDRQKKDNHIVAIAGDAAFTCGITLEALNNIASSTKRFILVINDNEWSIAKNVGAFSKYFNELITNPVYNKIHKDAENFLTQFPGGSSLIKFLSKAKRDTKELLAPSSIFEKLGIRYLGPIDGHDIESLSHFFEFAKQAEEPIVLHILTQKGRGFPVAIDEPEKWHGANPFDINTGITLPAKAGTPPKYQDVFGLYLSQLALENKKIFGITAAMPSGTGLDALQRTIPDRFIDVGIAEEHAVLLAAGMATQGMHPVCAIYSTFLQRAYDQIIHDVCLQNLPVTFCLDRAGLSPNDGPTHHGLFDLSYLRCIPNAIVMQPKDENELQDMIFTSTQLSQPTFIRYPRGSGVGVPLKKKASLLDVGKADELKTGEDLISIWALGDFVQVALKIAETLKRDYNLPCAVVNARFIKPLDASLLLDHAQKYSLIVTLEDNVLSGGFGSSILEFLSTHNLRNQIVRFGWPDEFIQHGSSVEQLRSMYGLTEKQLLAKILDSIQNNFNLLPVQEKLLGD